MIIYYVEMPGWDHGMKGEHSPLPGPDEVATDHPKFIRRKIVSMFIEKFAHDFTPGTQEEMAADPLFIGRMIGCEIRMPKPETARDVPGRRPDPVALELALAIASIAKNMGGGDIHG